MKYNLIILSFLIAIVLSSCSSFSNVEDATTIEVYKPAMQTNITITDLDIQQTKVDGTATGSTVNIAKLKNEAVADAIQKSKSDVLIQPSYSVVSKSQKSTVTVTGFAATYKNFRPVAERDSIFFKPDNQLKDNQFTNNIANNDAKVKTEKNSNEELKKNKNTRIFFGTFLGVMGVIVAIFLLII